jgi:hypothetical protein
MLRQPLILRFCGPSTKPRMSGNIHSNFHFHFPATLHLFGSWSCGNEIQAHHCCRLREAQRLAPWLCFASPFFWPPIGRHTRHTPLVSPTGPCLVTQTTKPVIASAGGHVWSILSAAGAKLYSARRVWDVRTGGWDRGGGCPRRRAWNTRRKTSAVSRRWIGIVFITLKAPSGGIRGRGNYVGLHNMSSLLCCWNESWGRSNSLV